MLAEVTEGYESLLFKWQLQLRMLSDVYGSDNCCKIFYERETC